jgi:hypothetical protein
MPSDMPDCDNAEAMCVALLKRALDGDVPAFKEIRDTVGERPVERRDLTSSDRSMSPVASMTPAERMEELARMREEEAAK